MEQKHNRPDGQTEPVLGVSGIMSCKGGDPGNILSVVLITWNEPEYPSLYVLVIGIVGILGAVLLTRRTREYYFFHRRDTNGTEDLL